MLDLTHAAGLITYAYNRGGLETAGHSFDIGVCQRNDRLGASEVLKHVIHRSTVIRDQGFHLSGVRAAELVDILVIVSDCYDPHILITADNPNGPDAEYRRKGQQKVKGYSVNITETTDQKEEAPDLRPPMGTGRVKTLIL